MMTVGSLSVHHPFRAVCHRSCRNWLELSLRRNCSPSIGSCWIAIEIRLLQRSGLLLDHFCIHFYPCRYFHKKSTQDYPFMSTNMSTYHSLRLIIFTGTRSQWEFTGGAAFFGHTIDATETARCQWCQAQGATPSCFCCVPRQVPLMKGVSQTAEAGIMTYHDYVCGERCPVLTTILTIFDIQHGYFGG